MRKESKGNPGNKQKQKQKTKQKTYKVNSDCICKLVHINLLHYYSVGRFQMPTIKNTTLLKSHRLTGINILTF